MTRTTPADRILNSQLIKLTSSIVFCLLFFAKQRKHVKLHTDKKENLIFLIYKEIQNGAVAKSYMTNGLLINGELFAHFLIY